MNLLALCKTGVAVGFTSCDFAHVWQKGREMQVLIADHDKLLVESLKSYLSRSGHFAKVASSAIECMDILRGLVPDVLVLDCELLWGGWQGVVALMGETPRLSGTLIILVADEDPRDGLSGSFGLPTPAWLRKPYRLTDLLTLIENRSHSVAVSETASDGSGAVNLRSGVQ